jgi:hypothetical protein
MFVLGGVGIAILIDTGLVGIGGELVIPATALTFAIWGFMGVMALWDARRAYQGFIITAVIMLPFALAPGLRFFALIGVWGAMLAYLSLRVHTRESASPPLFD